MDLLLKQKNRTANVKKRGHIRRTQSNLLWSTTLNKLCVNYILNSFKLATIFNDSHDQLMLA